MVALLVAAVVFSILRRADCAFFDRSRVRGLSRGWWFVVIIFVPIIGGLLWFIIGRGAGRALIGRRRTRTVAPDDDADFPAPTRHRGRTGSSDPPHGAGTLADLDRDGRVGDGGQPSR
ncbi:PLD nuclease N-terminal domain-containing protein [Agromyces hippuratus]|uniref:PLD nuclease N-terminal domain-containing protein n=1 Tax=Agromyces hippuratus TaxID=286438 RepID=UPI0035E86EA5